MPLTSSSLILMNSDASFCPYNTDGSYAQLTHNSSICLPVNASYCCNLSFSIKSTSAELISSALCTISSRLAISFSINYETSSFSFYSTSLYDVIASFRGSIGLRSLSTRLVNSLKLTDTSLSECWCAISQEESSQSEQKKGCSSHSSLRQTILASFLLMQVGKLPSLPPFFGLFSCFLDIDRYQLLIHNQPYKNQLYFAPISYPSYIEKSTISIIHMIEYRRPSHKHSAARSLTTVASSPSQLSHYQKAGMIGKGTFGKVYLVVHKKNHQKYAMKEVAEDPRYKNREVSLLHIMDHPNITKMFAHFHSTIDGQSTTHILMEHMETSLFAVIKDQRQFKRPIDLPFRRVITFQLFKALYYLTTNNICHRDLKPTNVLLNTENYELKICDFGSAKQIQKKENNVSYICSRYYRAPQLILNSTTYGCEVDMWSAGCIMIELLTLEPLFPGDSSVEQLIEIIKVLGTPSKQLLTAFSKSNACISLPEIKGSKWEKILKRYSPAEEELDLIKRIMTYDVGRRLSPLQALKHPFFAHLWQQQPASNLPQLFNFQTQSGKRNKKVANQLSKLFQGYRKSQKNQDSSLAETTAVERQA